LSAGDAGAGQPRGGHLDEVMRGLRWIGTARVLAQVVSWGLTIVTVRLLEPRDYGLVAISGLFTVLASLLMDGGLSVVLVARRDLPPRMQGAAVSGVLAVSLVLTGAIVAIAPLGAELFKNHALVNVLRVSSVQLPLAALAVVPTALLSRAFKFRELALAQAASSMLQGVATLWMAWSGAAYWALVLGTLFGGALRASILWISLKDRPVPNLDIVALRSDWLAGSQMVAQRLVYFAAQDFDSFMLGRLGGAAILGSYSLAKTLAHSALDQLAGIVNQVSMPAFAAKVGDHDAQLKGLLLLIMTIATLVFPLFWLGCVLSQAALPLLFGSRWQPMVIPFMAFMFMLPFRSIYALLDSAVVGTGRVSTTFRNMLGWAAVMMPLLFVAAHFGADWTAASWCVGFPIVFLIAMRRIARAFRVSLWQLLRPARAPLLSSLVSAAVAQVAIMQVKPYVSLMVQLAVGLLIGSVCYGLAMWRYAQQHFASARNLAGRLIRV
jgi:teichuronic acid exporter